MSLTYQRHHCINQFYFQTNIYLYFFFKVMIFLSQNDRKRKYNPLFKTLSFNVKNLKAQRTDALGIIPTPPPHTHTMLDYF